MIPRYTRPRMEAVWLPSSRFSRMLEVELAICDAWEAEGAIPAGASARIRHHARFSLERIDDLEKVTRHDVLAFLGSVQDSLDPDDARWLHYGVTSSDVVDTALSLMMVESATLILEEADRLLVTLARRAREHASTIMIGRTHGVHAEPITLGLKMLGWREEMKRQVERLGTARDTMRVGKVSGAVGTHATVPPAVQERACRSLGLEPAPVSSQILQRDRHAAFVTTLALVGGTVERISVECRHLQRTEVLEVQEPFHEGQKGSSAMPHKRNPVGFENLSGLARVLRGHALASMEDMALWHERDISHSSVERIILPDSCLLVDYMLHRLESLVAGLRVFPEQMRRNLELTGGLIHSQRVMLALVEAGMPRPEAYDRLQEASRDVWESRGNLHDRLLGDPTIIGLLGAERLAALFDPSSSLVHLPEIFRRAGLPLTDPPPPPQAPAASAKGGDLPVDFP